MKKLAFAVVVAAMTTLACNSSDGLKNKDAKAETKSHAAGSEDGNTIHLTKAMFLDQIMDYETNPQEWVYKGEKPGLVDFYADWCRPCKITSPILDELAKEYAGKINIYKVNVDEERELAAMFQVQSIPTFLYIPMEGQPSMAAGIAQTPEQTKEMFRQQIEQILLSESEM